MTDWIWSKADEKGLVRFAHPDAVLTAAAERHVDLGIERLAVEQTADGRRTIARAIYEGLQRLDPPVDYDRERYLHHGEYRQIIRTPRQILITEKHGTCLDLALLFCAFALSQDLMPLLVIVEGHAFAAISLMHGRQHWDARPRDEMTRFVDGGGLLRDGEVLLRLIERGWYLPIECTGFARSRALAATAGPEGEARDAAGFLAFDRAVDAGLEQLGAASRRFCYVLDVHLLQQELGFGTYAPPDLLAQAQAPAEHRPAETAELPTETLPMLAREILKHAPGLGERDRRDSLVEKLRRETGAGFPLRVDDAEMDLVYVLVRAFRNATIAAALRAILREFLADRTKYLHILATIDGLRSLSSLKPLLARQGIELPAVQRLYRASIADPTRAYAVASLDDALIALLESEPRTAAGVRPLIEFVERLARQTANAELRTWVDEHAGDAACLAELRGILDGEEPRPGGFDYLLIDVPSERPDRIEYWRYDRSGRRLAGDIVTSELRSAAGCPAGGRTDHRHRQGRRCRTAHRGVRAGTDAEQRPRALPGGAVRCRDAGRRSAPGALAMARAGARQDKEGAARALAPAGRGHSPAEPWQRLLARRSRTLPAGAEGQARTPRPPRLPRLPIHPVRRGDPRAAPAVAGGAERRHGVRPLAAPGAEGLAELSRTNRGTDRGTSPRRRSSPGQERAGQPPGSALDAVLGRPGPQSLGRR